MDLTKNRKAAEQMNINIYRTFFAIQKRRWRPLAKKIAVVDIIEGQLRKHVDTKVSDICYESGL